MTLALAQASQREGITTRELYSPRLTLNRVEHMIHHLSMLVLWTEQNNLGILDHPHTMTRWLIKDIVPNASINVAVCVCDHDFT